MYLVHHNSSISDAFKENLEIVKIPGKPIAVTAGIS